MMLFYSLTPNGEEAPAYIYEKDSDNGGLIYKTHGISHYITSNTGLPVAVWRIGQYECALEGTSTQEEIERMIESIYEEELP